LLFFIKKYFTLLSL